MEKNTGFKKFIKGCLYSAAVCLLSLNLCGCGALASYLDKQADAREKYEVTESYDTEPEETRFYFRNNKLKKQHYEKHGIEMGFESADEYEAAASAVVNNPNALHKTEAEDGDYVFYLEETNEFVIVSTDGYIRTYFLPSGGKSYYDRQ